MELLIYGGFNNYSASEFIKSMDGLGEFDVVSVRINSPGGDVHSGYGMIAKFKEHQGLKTVKIDGMAMSMGLFFAIMADDVESLDVSRGLLHRASFGTYYEENYMTEAEKQWLIDVNSDLRKMTESKIDVEAFTKITKYTLDDVFSMDQRIDVMLSANDMKKIGIVNRVNKISETKAKAIKTEMTKMAAEFGMKADFLNLVTSPDAAEETPKTTIQANKTTIIKMTKQELQAQHPDIFAEIIKDGVDQERARVAAFLPFAEIDANMVIEGIKGDEPITEVKRSEFAAKKIMNGQVSALENNGNEKIDTTKISDDEAPKSDAEKLAEKVRAEMMSVVK